MNPRSVAIFTAVHLEANAIAAALGMARPEPGNPTTASIDGFNISLHLIGIGAVGLDRIEFDRKPVWIIMAGVAGALDPSLEVGDVVMGQGPVALHGPGVHRGLIHTSERLISSPPEKAELFGSTKAAAVDMESAIVQQWAQRQGILFISIRAISDSAAQEVNPQVLGLVNMWGRPKPGAVAALLLRKPSAARDLFRLARDSKLAANRLGTAVRQLIRHLALLTSDNALAKQD
jgi:nucleoside phosphorylase